MSDTQGRARAQPVAVGPPRRGRSRAERLRAERGRRRRRVALGFAVGLLVVVVLAAVFVGSKLWHSFGPQNDYAGSGKKDLVIQVHAGDSTTAIGETLHNKDVVRTVKAFVEAAEGNEAISSIQPGYYRMRTEIPASAAVKRLADPENRVGKLVIPEGQQLDDTTDVKTNGVTPGIFTHDRQGQLRRTGRGQALRLGGATCERRPKRRRWPRCRCRRGPSSRSPRMGDDHRRIEGLIAPGTFNVNPSGVAPGDSGDADQRQRGAVREVGSAGHRHRDEHVALQHSGGRHRWFSVRPSRRTSPRWRGSSTTGWPSTARWSSTRR